MNEITHPDTSSQDRAQVPDTSMLPNGERPVAVELMNQAAQGAHDTIDSLASRAAPVMQQLGDSISAAEQALHARAEQLLDKRDTWAEGLRGTVRRHPLAAVATALALGLLIARISR